MNVAERTRRRTRAQLPVSVRRPFEVYLNGVLQEEGMDYVVRDGGLEFERELRTEGRLGVGRWTSMLLGVAGTYKQNDSVDVVYEVGGQRRVAAKLPLLPVD
jgi:hypothetical protein